MTQYQNTNYYGDENNGGYFNNNEYSDNHVNYNPPQYQQLNNQNTGYRDYNNHSNDYNKDYNYNDYGTGGYPLKGPISSGNLANPGYFII